jgi:uncharacterized protein
MSLSVDAAGSWRGYTRDVWRSIAHAAIIFNRGRCAGAHITYLEVATMSMNRFLFWKHASGAGCASDALHGYALITGASQGLGKAFAYECGRRGLNLALVALPNSGLPDVAQAIELWHGVHVEYLELDLTESDAPERVGRWVTETRLPISVLINNAGVGYNSRFEDSTLEENEACILLNALATVKITRLLLPALARRPRAFVLNVSSLSAYFPMPYMPVYAPTKTFVLNFGLALRSEMRGTSVGVSVLCPNGIRTNAEACRKIEAGGLAARLTCLDPEDVARYAFARMLAGRPVIVPGWLNRFAMWAGRFTPRPIVDAVVGAFWGKTARRPQADLSLLPSAVGARHTILEGIA